GRRRLHPRIIRHVAGAHRSGGAARRSRAHIDGGGSAMKAQLVKKTSRGQKGSLAFSIAIHGIVIVAIASITFRYPISAFLGMVREQHVVPEAIHYVKVQPAPLGAVGNGAQSTRPTRKMNPAPLL